MAETAWTEEDTIQANRCWEEYQREHDLSERKGQTAGIDPKTGRIWFGESIIDIVKQRRAEGLESPLSFERVGYGYYYRKSHRR
jgi:hypothetical protein